jgi:hypothetical protein
MIKHKTLPSNMGITSQKHFLQNRGENKTKQTRKQTMASIFQSDSIPLRMKSYR